MPPDFPLPCQNVDQGLGSWAALLYTVHRLANRIWAGTLRPELVASRQKWRGEKTEQGWPGLPWVPRRELTDTD